MEHYDPVYVTLNGQCYMAPRNLHSDEEVGDALINAGFKRIDWQPKSDRGYVILKREAGDDWYFTVNLRQAGRDAAAEQLLTADDFTRCD